MRRSEGWVRIFRRLWDHPVFRDGVEAAVFAWLISNAAWQSDRTRSSGGPVKLPIGGLLVTERDLSDRFRLPRSTLRRLLDRMQRHGMITMTRPDTAVSTDRSSGTLIVVQNYQAYQNVETLAPVPDHKRTTSGPRPDHKRTKQRTVKAKTTQPDSGLFDGVVVQDRTTSGPQADHDRTNLYTDKNQERRKEEANLSSGAPDAPGGSVPGDQGSPSDPTVQRPGGADRPVKPRTRRPKPKIEFGFADEQSRLWFVEFWAAYGVDVAKKEAARAFRAALSAGTSAADLIVAARRVAAMTDPQYRVLPARWLREERWNDRLIDRRSRNDPYDWLGGTGLPLEQAVAAMMRGDIEAPPPPDQGGGPDTIDGEYEWKDKT